ncbi:Beta-lactamase precursor [Pseudovibrio sp. Ad46]|uniref:serine hydrolase domain-containing protein n=1 Tax=unclassified Pseudovibrio TaxID=2627060 RepID=UPI00070FEDA0|nr:MULTISPECIES: serine hydrolase domain-containing protein [unclassified Pseudovibrio]KZK81602.1 Beta-lactamase precursor [Pseudovibrio sp. Ad46]
MNTGRKILIAVHFALISALTAAFLPMPANAVQQEHTQSRAYLEEQLDALMRDGAIPGLAVYVSSPNGQWTIFKGVQDLDNSVPVGPETIFEIGSNSKAFTGALAQLYIARGVLDPNRSVQSYLPWFTPSYNGVEPRVRDLMYHTSGLAFGTIEHVRSGNSDSAEKIVRSLVDDSLVFEPGTAFSYATLNYTVLALIIEEVTQKSFATLIKSEILEPLDLHKTWIPDGTAAPQTKSDGHKLRYGQAARVEAPLHIGHAPAGYIHSNLSDMRLWAEAILTAAKKPASELDTAFAQSLKPNMSVAPSPTYGSFYGTGWFVFNTWGTEYYHAGANPTFSSCIDIKPDNDTVIVVLANLNSNLVAESCRSILFYLETGNFGHSSEFFKTIDRYAMGLSALALVVVFVSLALCLYRCFCIFKEKRISTRIGVLKSGFSLALWVGLATGLALVLPSMLFYMLPLSVLFEWGPLSLAPTIILLWCAVALAALFRFLGTWQSTTLR